jgi:hypothetical protein
MATLGLQPAWASLQGNRCPTLLIPILSAHGSAFCDIVLSQHRGKRSISQVTARHFSCPSRPRQSFNPSSSRPRRRPPPEQKLTAPRLYWSPRSGPGGWRSRGALLTLRTTPAGRVVASCGCVGPSAPLYSSHFPDDARVTGSSGAGFATSTLSLPVQYGAEPSFTKLHGASIHSYDGVHAMPVQAPRGGAQPRHSGGVHAFEFANEPKRVHGRLPTSR